MEFVFKAPSGTLFIFDRQRLPLSRSKLDAAVQVLKAHLAQAERAASAAKRYAARCQSPSACLRSSQ